jgi:sigma-E factor negative regulatory protein RseC
MSSSSCVEQKGIIEEVVNGFAKVRVSSFAACAKCHAKSACGITEGSTRFFQVPVAKDEYSTGESVIIEMERHMGLRAAFIAYFLPFLIVITSLLILTSFNVSELFSGTISILILIPYFTGLYFFRDHLKRSFKFTLRKVT